MPGDRTSAKNSTNQTIISVQCKFFFFFCRSYLFVREVWSKNDIICLVCSARHTVMAFS